VIRHVYVHVPFCLRKCGYCSFYSLPVAQGDVTCYLSTLTEEITLYTRHYEVRPHTLYLGGGTPSLLTPRDIAALAALFDLSACTEITLEVNPATVDDARAAALAAINRVSVGAQSFDDDELRLLGRLHTAADTVRTVELLRRQGQHNISLDLMYGLPGQKPEKLRRSLEALERRAPPQVSLYCLSLEPDTPLWPRRAELPGDDAVADMYDLLCEQLARMGYRQYELSNFARPGYESRHNLAYWDGAEYLGFGPAAAGNVPAGRYANPASVAAWRAGVCAGELLPNLEPVDRAGRMSEYMFLGLRRAEGIEEAEFTRRFDALLMDVFGEAVRKYEGLGMLSREDGRVALTPRARFVSNEIFQAFC